MVGMEDGLHAQSTITGLTDLMNLIYVVTAYGGKIIKTLRVLAIVQCAYFEGLTRTEV